MSTRNRALLVAGISFLVVEARAHGATPVVARPAEFAISPPMSKAPPAKPGTGPAYIVPLRQPRQIAGPPVTDPVLQTVFPPLVNVVPGVHFDGVDDTVCDCAPSDANMAAGPNHLLQTVNTAWAVYDKNGNIFPGFPKTLGSIWDAIGPPCNQNSGDVIAQYDRLADRWLITQLGGQTAPFLECVAVSTSNDPTGSYALYAYNFNNNFPDYPKWAVWPTASNPAYLAHYNLFANGSTFVGSDACAYDRTAILAANPVATEICFQLGSESSMLPSDLDGSAIPPAGSPGFFITFPDTSSLHLYALAPNFANPPASTLTGPVTLPVASFQEACGGGVCVPQSGSATRLDSLADRLMYRFAYRNFGDHESAVVNHSVTGLGGSGIRWYELQGLNASPVVFQQGTFSPDTTYRWMGSIAEDKARDIAVGYSVSSSSLHPGIAYTGRVPADPLGQMESEAILLTGSGSQTGGVSRWGDYTAMRIDPADDCTFWYTNQYLKTNGSFNWSTHIGSFAFPNCTGGQGNPDFNIFVSPPSDTINRGDTASYSVTIAALNGFSGAVSLSITGLPAFTTARFTPPTVTGSGTSTLTIATKKYLTRMGTYNLTITGTSGSLTHSAGASLTITKVVDDTAPDALGSP